MAIAPINSVSFRNNYNTQVNFEGKKREKSEEMHIPMALKAIPLATMLAMSPLNEVDAKNVIEAGYTQVADAPDENYGPNNKSYTYYDNYAVKRAWPENVKVVFNSTNGDRKPELVTLYYNVNRAGKAMVDGVRTDVIQKNSRMLDVYGVKVVNITRKREDGQIVDQEKEYYAVGELYSISRKYNKNDNTLIEDSGLQSTLNYAEEITESLYDNLVDTMGDKLTQSVENETRKPKSTSIF